MNLKSSGEFPVAGYITIVLVFPLVISVYMYLNMYDEIHTDEFQSFLDITIKRLQGGVLQYQNEEFHVIPNVVVPGGGERVTSDTDIVVCTQTSINNLHYISTLVTAWDGHVSIGVFSYDQDVTNVLHYIILLRICFVNVKRKVTFHIVFPISKQPIRFRNIKDMAYNCRDLSLFKAKFEDRNWDHLHIRYPVNIMRNVAIIYSKSPYIFNIDIDLTPSSGLKTRMETFLKHEVENVQKRAYIIPCFESNITLNALKSKEHIAQHIANGSVQIREFGVSLDYHGATNYSRWLELPCQDTMDIAYFVNYTYKFEPYFIADRRHLPMFDSRFKGHGYDRISQVCEAHVSGFEFAVMDNAFVIHDGFQDPKKHSERVREQTMEKRLFFLSVFTKDLKTKYPFSPRSCEMK